MSLPEGLTVNGGWQEYSQSLYFLMDKIKHNGETWPRSSPSSTRAPETNMSRLGLKPGPPRWEAKTLAKSYSNSLCCCYLEPLQRDVSTVRTRNWFILPCSKMSTVLLSSPVSRAFPPRCSTRRASSASVRSVSFDLRLRSHTAPARLSELAGQPGKKQFFFCFSVILT